MNKKIQKLVEPSVRLYLLFMVLFAVVSYFVDHRLAIGEGIVIVILLIYFLINTRKKRRQLEEYIESVTYNVEAAKNDTLMNFPLPMAVFRMEDNQVLWGNQMFFQICGKNGPSFGDDISGLVPEFSSKWLLDGKNRCPGIVVLGDKKYQVHGHIVRGTENEGQDYMGITYWVDVTEFDDIKIEYSNSRPVIAIMVVDNFDELAKNVSDRGRTELQSRIDDKVESWCSDKDGFLRRYDRDRYVFIFEERHLKNMMEKKFDLLEAVHSVVVPGGVHATMSIGMGKDGSGYSENLSFALLAMEMALSRGGDQAVIKNRFNFEFFGGRGSEVETRTKVKSRGTANAMSELINASSQVMVMGHKYADLDCLGASCGVCCMARKLGKPTRIVLDMQNNASGKMISLVRRMPEYADVFISGEEALLTADSRTLLVVVDTNRPEQVENESLLMACNRVVVIDHHRRAATYVQNASLSLYEPYASSVCELMAEVLQESVEQTDILRIEAEAMLAGIVMDTKSFTIRTGERTFDAAAFLRRAGADTTNVKKLMQNDMDDTVARYKILQSAKLYRGTIAVAAPDTPQDRIVAAQAADEMLNISGVQASIVAFPTEDGGVIMSARSIGDINVQVLLEQLGGGGNKSAAGVQLKNTTLREGVNRLIEAINKYLEE